MYIESIQFNLMKRRDFLSSSALATTGMALGLNRIFTRSARRSFQLNYAPHFGMFGGSESGGFLNELDFMAEQGFKSLEDNDMKKRSIEDQQAIADRMEKHGMTS